MASTMSSSLVLSLPRARIAQPVSCKAEASKPALQLHPNRRNLLLFSLTAMPALTAREGAGLAEDIPLFGLRKNLRKAGEEAVEIVKVAEKKIEAAEKEILKEAKTAEKEIETTVGFGALAQAGAVVAAEVVGVVVASAVVNGILGPEPQKY